MKHFLTILFACIMCSGAFAQTFKYDFGMHVADTITEPFAETNLKFKTETPETITFKWKIVENTLPSSWDYSLCDYASCYTSLPDSSSMWEISKEDAEGGRKAFFKLNFVELKGAGTYKLVLYVYDSNDIQRGDTVSFTITNGMLSTAPPLESTTLIYPNPASGHFNIETTTPAQVSLFNVSGQRVLGQSEGLQQRIDVSHLAPGVYFCEIKDQHGTIMREKVLIQ